jgi:hypothetical protein
MNYTNKFYKDRLRIRGRKYTEFMQLDSPPFLQNIISYSKVILPTQITPDIEYFKTDPTIRKKILNLTNKIINISGYRITKAPDYIKELYPSEIDPDVTIYVIRLFIPFLKLINMTILSKILKLVLCYEKVRKKSGQHSKPVRSKITNTTPKCNISGLIWTQNSCYLDSVLLCLMGPENSFIHDHILNKDLSLIEDKNLFCGKNKKKDLKVRSAIQTELNTIYKHIKNPNSNDMYCTALRKFFKYCGVDCYFHTGIMQDPTEFLEYLCQIFDIKYTLTFNFSPHMYIMIQYPEFEVYNFRRMEYKKTPFTPPETINGLYIQAVVIYTHRHYTCYLKCDKYWFYYDDLSTTLFTYVGEGFKSALNDRREEERYNIKTGGVLYFYSK